MNSSIKKNEQFWTVIFIVLPMVLFSSLSKEFSDNSSDSILFAALFGGFGALLGWSIFMFTKQKSVIIKIVSLITLITVGILTISFLGNSTKSTLGTCEICGYKTLKINDKECDLCGSDVWESLKDKSLYSSEKEWVREEQLFLYSLESLNEKPDFYSPMVEEGYHKDEKWKPSINEKDLKEDFKK